MQAPKAKCLNDYGITMRDYEHAVRVNIFEDEAWSFYILMEAYQAATLIFLCKWKNKNFSEWISEVLDYCVDTAWILD